MCCRLLRRQLDLLNGELWWWFFGEHHPLGTWRPQHQTRPGKTENGKPRAQGEECAPVKTFLREAQTKTLERGGMPLFQREESKSTRRPLFTIWSIRICWWPLKSVGYVMLTERRNGMCWGEQVTLPDKVGGSICSRGEMGGAKVKPGDFL